MEVTHDINTLKNIECPVVTIGSFDGVHLAHQKIVRKVVEIAEDLEGTSVIVTFDPHPRQVIYPQAKDLELISSLEEKEALLESFGVDYLLILPFTVEFARLSPEEYIEQFIIGGLHPSAIVLGYDHRFGLNRGGDIGLIRQYQKQGNYTFHLIPRQIIDEQTISSSEIRRALGKGEVGRAKELLGRPYNLKGRVVKGMQVGRTMGFPTANLQVEDPRRLIPSYGIYAVEVDVEDAVHRGMLYIGTKPTMEGSATPVIEIHLFYFDKEIYGQELNVRFLKFIRKDQKFEGIEALQAAIEKDRIAVLSYFGQYWDKPISRPPKTAVVILNYNGLDYLKQFLPGIEQHLGQQHAIVIADNASTDRSVDYIRRHHPEVKIIELETNYGFAGGYNRALECVEADYYILLNSDIEVVSDWISPIISTMDKHPDMACAQPRVMSWSDRTKLEYAGAAGGWIDALGYPFCRGRILDTTEVEEGQYLDEAEVFWATGAAMVVRAGVFRELRGFDDWFFAHQEEIDFCWRIKRAGYRVMVFSKNPIYHVGGGTLSYNSPRKTYLNFRNSLAMLIKNEDKKHLWWKFFGRLVLDGVAGVYFAFKGEFAQVWSVVRAHFSIYGHLSVLLRQRRTIKRKIQRLAIGPARTHIGRYRGSIIYLYYLRGIRQFRALPGIDHLPTAQEEVVATKPHFITK